MNPLRNLFACLVLALTAQGAMAAPELLVNGTFETGDFSGWLQSGDTGTQTISGDTIGGTLHSGSIFSDGAYPGPGYLSQSIVTTAGTLYTLQFDLKRWDAGNRGPGDATDNYAEVMFGGQTLLASTNIAGDWVHFTFNDITVAGGPTLLRIGSTNLYDYNQWDNFSLIAAGVIVDDPADGTVPEPASLAIVLLGLGVLGWTLRKQA